MIILLSYPNFVWGLLFVDLLILDNRLTVLNANYNAKQMIIKCFDEECEKYPKRGKRVFSLVFLDPSSPRLASSSPRPPNSFMVKKPTHLGELITSALSFSSPGRAATTPNDPLPINRHPRGVLRGSKG